MKLTGGHTPWEALYAGTIPQYPRLEADICCDVVVIGSGISGALAAYVLTMQGADVAVLEKKRVGCGSTSANSGLLQFMNDDSLNELIGRFGERKGTGFYRMCANAVNRLAGIAEELPSDVDFRRRSSLYYATIDEDAGMIRNEYDTLIRHGFEVEYWDRDHIKSKFPFSRAAALYTKNDAEVNPYKLALALLSSAAAKGLKVFEHSCAKQVKYSEKGVSVQTVHGSVRADTLIWALGYETQEWKPDKSASLECTYAIMTEPVADLSFWHERALVWESNRPYLYMRTTPDNRIIAGGLDEPVPKNGRPKDRLAGYSQRLINEIRDHFPGLVNLRAEYSWSGLFGFTRDGIPLIGRHPRFPHSYFIEGYGGSGTVYSMIAADLLAQAVSGSEPEELSWFSLTRSFNMQPGFRA
ncbi:NAD(P)/FAD-dependent oxidoreductase [Paenibacillus sp. DMB20]|uniref:NAD(P)/FAD-dependent oxidoreductase n=1 Tax=Paenibacillus sp. DMB20 TaxID=1642570 RepID=UPI000627E2E8|nr:FAD-binding oxidoreductase [Paenibacillus sp. DMB20]KKO52935.1 amino acid oxidase [Paenibacillus sp. DMB20]KKO53586.1 amino acid oxidase [Paenibacillus sp. DMB20]